MMAAASSVSSLTVIASSSKTVFSRNPGNLGYVISGMNSFLGLKPQNGAVAMLGVPECADRSFARIVGSLRSMKGKGSRCGRGGALSSKCNATEDIFRIAAIMNGLVLIGVAVGLVLLRFEAFVEEAE